MKKITTVAILLLSMTMSYAQWTKFDSPKGIQVNELYKYSTDLYAGTSKGVYKDSAGVWVKLSNSVDYNVSSIFDDGTNLYAGTTTNGVYRSGDNGVTWFAVNNSLASLNVQVVNSYKNNIVVGTKNGVFMSDNNGLQWTNRSTNIGNKDIKTVLQINDSLLIGTANGVFMSLDTGKTWTGQNTGLASKNVSSMIFDGSKVFASIKNGGVYVSLDLGQTWSAQNTMLSNTNANDIFKLGEYIYVGTTDSLFSAKDSTTLVWKSFPIENATEQVSTIEKRNNLIFIGNSTGTYQQNTDSTFATANDGFPAWEINNLKVIADFMFCSTEKGIFQYNKVSSNWEKNISFPNNNMGDFTMLNDSVYLMYNNTGIYKTEDTLKTWVTLKIASNISAIMVLDTTIFFGSNGVQRSTDLGVTWLPVNIGLVGSYVGYLGSVGDTLIAGSSTQFGGLKDLDVFMSTNNGDIWSEIPIDGYVSTLYADDNIYTAVGNPHGDGGYGSIYGIGKYQKQTSTFDISRNGFLNSRYTSSSFQKKHNATGVPISLTKVNDVLLFTTRYNQVVVSFDNGNEWVHFNKGLNEYLSENNNLSGYITEYSNKIYYVNFNKNRILSRNVSELVKYTDTPTNLTAGYDTIPPYLYIEITFNWDDNSTSESEFLIAFTDSITGISQLIDTLEPNSMNSIIDDVGGFGRPTLNSESFIIVDYDGDYSHKIYFTDVTNTTSVSNLKKRGISIYPNPATSQLNIENKNGKFQSIAIYSILGKEIQSSNNILKSNHSINLDAIPTGTYLLKITEENNNVRFVKFVKE